MGYAGTNIDFSIPDQAVRCRQAVCGNAPPGPGFWPSGQNKVSERKVCGIICPIFGPNNSNTVKRIIRFSLLMVLVLLVEACSSSHHAKKHKKLKPGKPIPCPQKDC